MTVYNCSCDGAENNSRTLAELREELMIRLGYAAMVDNPPPGQTALLNSFLQSAQRNLYRQYDVLRTERFFEWDIVQGERFYDIADGADSECTTELDPRKLTWVGIQATTTGNESSVWYPLVAGINPAWYSFMSEGFPTNYEIRQCIEIWPPPDSGPYKLRIKGRFGLEPFSDDYDKCTIDDEAVFLYALARAKAHEGSPDAANYQRDCMTYIGNMVAGAHLTRRYVPNSTEIVVQAYPVWTPLT